MRTIFVAMVQARIATGSDLEVIRAWVDVRNVTMPEDKRISDTEYKFHEGLILAFRELGTINSPAAESFVKQYVGKVDMASRSYRNYRNSLRDKGWLIRRDKQLFLLPAFELHNKTIRDNGEIATIMITIVRE